MGDRRVITAVELVELGRLVVVLMLSGIGFAALMTVVMCAADRVD